MTYPTLLRYPGGKTRAVKTLEKFSVGSRIVSPFFGGGSFELSLLNKGKTIEANDKFYCLANFWNTVNTVPVELANIVEPFLGKVDKGLFKKMQECLKQVEQDYWSIGEPLANVGEFLETVFGESTLTSLAGCFYIVNRCSFSGATLSGGYSSSCSVNRFTLSGVEKIRSWQPTSKLSFTCLDYQNFLNVGEVDSTWFLDPPYMLSESPSNNLYGVNGGLHRSFDHIALERIVRDYSNNGGFFLLTYNDSPMIRQMYEDYNILEAEWVYGMNKSKKSSEIIITNL